MPHRVCMSSTGEKSVSHSSARCLDSLPQRNVLSMRFYGQELKRLTKLPYLHELHRIQTLSVSEKTKQPQTCSTHKAVGAPRIGNIDTYCILEASAESATSGCTSDHRRTTTTLHQLHREPELEREFRAAGHRHATVALQGNAVGYLHSHSPMPLLSQGSRKKTGKNVRFSGPTPACQRVRHNKAVPALQRVGQLS